MGSSQKLKTVLKNKIHALQSIKANIEHGFPYRKLNIIGVTGTNGKTTTTQMIYHILKENGLKTGYMSTISAKIGDQELDTGFHVTTPDPWLVPKYLKMMVAAGIEFVVVESTSQGLEQNRLWGVEYEAVTITNIQSDHLDYHKTWENYAQAKFRIVKKLKTGGLAVFNKDDNAVNWLKQQLAMLKKDIKQIWYSKADVTDKKKSLTGYEFCLEGVDFKLPLLGDYNLENALAAIRICEKYLPLKDIAAALVSFPTPVGRMEVIRQRPFTVIVDFAHTPEALEAALQSVVELKNKEAKIITVFGCAGKRDVARRTMGAVSARLSDVTILTAEDPRDEILADINHEIFKYGQEHNAEMVAEFANNEQWKAQNVDSLKIKVQEAISKHKKPFIAFNEDSVQSRRDAIACALSLADAQDIVFVTGKAHEQSLCFNETEFAWDDRVEVKTFLEK